MNNTNTNPSTGLQSGPVRINNAGLVLLNGFFPPLFERLCLRADQQFVNSTAQRRAVHFLQYLVSGQSETAEHHLHLNKLLCGLAPHEPLEAGIAITDQEAELCQGLLASVIQHWSAIGSSSIEGFRGNWMIRDGTLTEVKDHWDLIVERRAYDVLLARSPFSYSVIKHPWMEKAIYVTWPA
jgi:Contractile injection system tape measure protein